MTTALLIVSATFNSTDELGRVFGAILSRYNGNIAVTDLGGRDDNRMYLVIHLDDDSDKEAHLQDIKALFNTDQTIEGHVDLFMHEQCLPIKEL